MAQNVFTIFKLRACNIDIFQFSIRIEILKFMIKWT